MSGKTHLLLINGILILVMILNFIFKFFSNTSIILFFSCFLGFTIYFIGLEKDRNFKAKNTILTIIIFVFAYYIITYILGLFTGFNLTAYSLKFINILKNILPAFILICLVEYYRFLVIRKGRFYSVVIASVTLACFFAETSILFRFYDMTRVSEIYRFLILVFIPYTSKHVMLSYLSYHNGFKPGFIYRILMELPIYFLPLFPDFGIYLNSIINLILPIILIYIVNLSIIKSKDKLKTIRDNKLFRRVSLVIVSILLIMSVILTTGWFRYFTVAVGSGSMEPNINKGDLLFVKKMKPEEQKNLKVDDILVFNYDNKTVVHRIVRIEMILDEFIYYTKGDNNEDEDGYPIRMDKVIGTVITRIRFLGYPTILISEAMA